MNVPASFFGIILGLVGLGGAWRVASRLWNLSPWIAETVMFIAAALWLLLLVLYAGKWLRARAVALAEFHHPILCCFVGIIPVSTALVGMALRPYVPTIAWTLAAIGILGQLVFGVYRTGQLWMGGRDPEATTPILYLPTVAGSFVSAIVLSAFGHAEWGMPFFGAGMFSWLAIESVLVHRLYTAKPLAEALRPTLGIQLAPPAVGCAAYLSLTSGPPDLFATALMGYALFQVLVLMRLLPWIASQAFSPGYWAFTFGVTALALGMLRFVERGSHGPIALMAPVIFIAANVVIAFIALRTVGLLLQGKLLPPRATPPARP